MDKTLDPAILAALPTGCNITSVKPHGSGSWSTGYKIATSVNGAEVEFFLKIIQRPTHEKLAAGEYTSRKELQKYLPDSISIPLAHGPLTNDTSSSFFLTPFRDLSTELPTPIQLVDVLQKLHQTSLSPTGKFGFHVTTYNGIVPLLNEWCDTWEEYFTRQLYSDIEWSHRILGPDPEFDIVADEFFKTVVPRLLRPLQTGGRHIDAVLVHGDVRSGNVEIEKGTRRVILFDACCCYAHNEVELGMMREPRYQFTGEYLKRYMEVVPASEPVEDFDDRNALYAMRDNIINSGLHSHRAFLRKQARKEMQRLIDKNPKGIDGFRDPK
ncbi:hypothetical protein HYALB_00011535 [Hymenoscyphus albidus]|uniref:protein-ribulosamine 3-kinase n=1 Tax=Hymenoscyphus albidus TaxID=595503 RepID=A0A9N9QA28_9HELO|nr:hypothetical protein HYALB_00011535 [Hymenoscyphus albidus]